MTPVRPSSSPRAPRMKSDSAQRDAHRHALAEAAAEQPAPAHPEERLDELEAGRPWASEEANGCSQVSTRVCTWLEAVGEQGAAEEQHAAEEQPPGRSVATYSMIRNRPKNSRLEPRSRLEDQDAEAHQPHQQDRAEVAPAGQVDEQHPPAGERERVAVRDEIAGEGDDQQQLGDLARLEAERPDADPDPRAVDPVPMPGPAAAAAAAARPAAGVGVPLEHAVVAQHHERRTNSATPRVVHFSCAGDVGSAARSSRRISARPRPLRAATTGSSSGSAYGATLR